MDGAISKLRGEVGGRQEEMMGLANLPLLPGPLTPSYEVAE